MAETRSVHFPSPARAPAPEVEPGAARVFDRGQKVIQDGISPKDTGPVNAIAELADALREVETVRVKLRGMLVTENRHGDLFVCLGATRRLESAIQALIEVEEGAP